MKMVKIESFWVQIDVISQNFRKVVIKIFPYKFLKILSVSFMDRNVVENVIKGVNFVKIFGENGQNLVILA